LRMDQLRPDPEGAPAKVDKQLRLFDHERS
jgi:hypothetical protein